MGIRNVVSRRLSNQSTYLDKISKVNQHDLTLRFPATGSVKTNRNDFVHSTSLNPVLVDGEFEDLDSHVDGALSDGSQLSLKAQHHIPSYVESQ